VGRRFVGGRFVGGRFVGEAILVGRRFVGEAILVGRETIRESSLHYIHGAIIFLILFMDFFFALRLALLASGSSA
jgi:hypothetical protein